MANEFAKTLSLGRVGDVRHAYDEITLRHESRRCVVGLLCKQQVKFGRRETSDDVLSYRIENIS